MKIIFFCFLLLIGCQNATYHNYIETQTIPETVIKHDIDRYLITKYKDSTVEELYVLYYQNDKLIQVEKSFTGDPHRVNFSLWEIYARCKELKSNKIIISHNHINNYFANPSIADIRATNNVREFFSPLNITLVAHIVVSNHDTHWL